MTPLPLSTLSTVIGAIIIALRLPGIIAPEKYRNFAVKFPRSVLYGRILISIVAAIVWVVMFRAARDSDDWRWAQPIVVVGVPVAVFLVYRYGVHYLALRATAAVMLLTAKLMVDATDVSEVELRLFVTTLAYIWVVAAIWMTVAPHHFRDLIGWAMANNQRCRVLCSWGTLLGVILVLLGTLVY
jgi:hypothetical protein